MYLYKLLLLYNTMKHFPTTSATKHCNYLSSRRILRLRITASLIFKIAYCFRLIFSGRRYDPGELRLPRTRNLTSKTVGNAPGIKKFIKDIATKLPEWNAHLDKSNVIDKTCFFDNSIYHTCRVAQGVRNIYLTTRDEQYLDYYNRLLDTIERCLICNIDSSAILCAPKEDIPYTPKGTPVRSVSGLVMVISGFGKVSNEITENLEQGIIFKFNALLTTMDYNIKCYCAVGKALDLAPNARYDNLKCYLYVAIRLSQRALTRRDVRIFKYMLKTPLNYSNVKTPAAVAEVLVAINLLYSVYLLWNNTAANPATSGITKDEFIKMSIAWIQPIKDILLSNNPEIDTILYLFYTAAGRYTSRDNIIMNIEEVLNVVYDASVKHITPRTPVLECRIADRYWYTTTTADKIWPEESPEFEYLILYSRIMDYYAAKD